MTRRLDLVCVHVSQRVRHGLQSLERSGLGIALITDDDGRLLGTLTDGDIRRAFLSNATLDSPLEPIFCRSFVTVGPEASRAEVLDLMQARAIAQIPIVASDRRLVGLHLLREVLGGVERPNWAVIMAGGKGLRLRPLTETIPKPMLRIAGRPILERLVLHLVGFGVRRVYLAVNYLAQSVIDHFGDGTQFGCRIEYLHETVPLGTGGALGLLPEKPEHPLLVLNGDLVAQFDVGQLLSFHTKERPAVTIGTSMYTHTVPFGVLELEGQKVVSMEEKPTTTWRTNAGIYVVEPRVVSRVRQGVEMTMPGLIGSCMADGERVVSYLLDGEWIDVGSSDELRRARGEVTS